MSYIISQGLGTLVSWISENYDNFYWWWWNKKIVLESPISNIAKSMGKSKGNWEKEAMEIGWELMMNNVHISISYQLLCTTTKNKHSAWTPSLNFSGRYCPFIVYVLNSILTFVQIHWIHTAIFTYIWIVGSGKIHCLVRWIMYFH